MSARHSRMHERAPNNQGVHDFTGVFESGGRWRIDSVNGLAIWSPTTEPVTTLPRDVMVDAMRDVFAVLLAATKKPIRRAALEDHASADGWCAINGRAFDRNLLRIALDELKGDLVVAFVPVHNNRRKNSHAFVLAGDGDALAGIMPGTDLDGVTGPKFQIRGLK